jgi:transposase
MQTVTTIGFDIAKSVFQVHGVDAAGEVVIRRQLKRRSVLAPEAATLPGRHRSLRLVSLLVSRTPGARPYRAINATGLRKALRQAAEERYGRCWDLRGRPTATMRFVPTKTPEQQSCLMCFTAHAICLSASRPRLIRSERTSPSSALSRRSGVKGSRNCCMLCADPSDKRVPKVARACLAALGDQLISLKQQIVEFDRMIMAWHRSNQTSKLIPGPSNQDVTSRPGLGSFRSSTRVGARTGSAASANKVTAIYAACSWPAHSPSFATPRATAPSIGLGSRRC